MNKDEAYNILLQVLSQLKATLQEHQIIKEALDTLKNQNIKEALDTLKNQNIKEALDTLKNQKENKKNNKKNA